MRDILNDTILSLLTGLALLLVVRGTYVLFVGYLPDAQLLAGDHPLARLAFARFALFTVLVALLMLPVCWPLARHAAVRTMNTALPGAACAFLLFLLVERTVWFDPFPSWLDYARGAVLFAALPLALRFWWRRGLRGGG